MKGPSTRSFFRVLFPTGVRQDIGYVVVAYFGGSGKFGEGGGITKSQFFSWPSQEDDLVAFCTQNRDMDLYTSAALFHNNSSRKGDNIKAQWAAVADADSLPLNKVLVEPTMTVQTSEGRHHMYWVVKKSDPKALTEISKSIAHTHQADGCDPGGWDAGQLLRIPGTSNNKYEAEHGITFDVRILPTASRTITRYDIDTLKQFYPQISGPLVRIPAQVSSSRSASVTAADPSSVAHASVMPDEKEWLFNQQVVREAKDLLDYSPVIQDLAQAPVLEGHDRSKRMWKLLGTLARHGIKKNVALYIAYGAPCNKYTAKEGRTTEELWHELCKAYNSPENLPISSSLDISTQSNEPQETQESPKETPKAFVGGIPVKASAKSPKKQAEDLIESFDLLEPAERTDLPDDTFIDRYSMWAQTKTDSPVVYHRTGAASVLTTVFGEFGSCPVSFDVNLTQWFLLLGPTTRARKSTATGLWNKLLDNISNQDYPYSVGSNVTQEALYGMLKKKHGRSSLLFRDEAHGLLYEQDRKNYHAGEREFFTSLYGGQVPKQFRAGTMQDDEGDVGSSTSTNFVLFLCGTIQQVTGALTLEDYQSGFMSRFLPVDADPPPLTEEQIWMEQAEQSSMADDTVRRVLMNELVHGRDFWYNKIHKFGEPITVFFEDDAWKRLQKARTLLYKRAVAHSLHEVLEPVSQRMGISLMKSCVLIAMSERKTKVQMRHVHKAMDLTMDWFRSSVKIAGMILDSKWSAKQNDILQAVRGRADGITRTDIYRRFRTKMEERDLESALKVLQESGEIRAINLNNRIRYLAGTTQQNL